MSKQWFEVSATLHIGEQAVKLLEALDHDDAVNKMLMAMKKDGWVDEAILPNSIRVRRMVVKPEGEPPVGLEEKLPFVVLDASDTPLAAFHMKKFANDWMMKTMSLTDSRMIDIRTEPIKPNTGKRDNGAPYGLCSTCLNCVKVVRDKHAMKATKEEWHCRAIPQLKNMEHIETCGAYEYNPIYKQ